MLAKLLLDIHEVINKLNYRRFGDLKECIKENKQIVVYLYADEYKYVSSRNFAPLDVASARQLFADVASRIPLIRDELEEKRKKEKGEEGKEKKKKVETKEYKADIALFWYTYFLDRQHSYYSDLYTLFYYVPSVAFISSLRAINDIKKVAEEYNLRLRYYGELYYNMPVENYLTIGEWGEEKYERIPPYPDLVRPEEIFAWVIGGESLPNDEKDVRNIEEAYDALVLNVVRYFGNDADEILDLVRKIRTVPNVIELDKHFREVVKKVRDAEKKMVDALGYLKKESAIFEWKTPVTIITPNKREF